VLGLALAGVATVGVELLVTVTLAVPLTAPLEAVTVNGPPTVVAVKSPVPLIVPPPDTVHVNAALITAPNWSRAVAVNSCVFPTATVAVAGVTVIDVSVWLTVTLTLLVVVSPPASRIVTVRV
jgi:hypothetical protein